MIISSINASNDSVLYNLQQTGSTGILIRFASKEFTENFTLPQLPFYINYKLFIPACELVYVCTYVCMYA